MKREEAAQRIQRAWASRPRVCIVCFEPRAPFDVGCAHPCCGGCLARHALAHLSSVAWPSCPTCRAPIARSRLRSLLLLPSSSGTWPPFEGWPDSADDPGRPASADELLGRLDARQAERDAPPSTTDRVLAAEFGRWARTSDARRCPQCDAVIVKDGGCSQMRCTRCDHAFRWEAAARPRVALRPCAQPPFVRRATAWRRTSALELRLIELLAWVDLRCVDPVLRPVRERREQAAAAAARLRAAQEKWPTLWIAV